MMPTESINPKRGAKLSTGFEAQLGLAIERAPTCRVKAEDMISSFWHPTGQTQSVITKPAIAYHER